MATERIVDVAIIGAGTAGLTALAEVRKITQNYVIIDGGKLGTTCARVGCMPSKAALQIAATFHSRTLFDRYGIEGKTSLHIDQAQAMEHVRDLRDIFVDRVLADTTDEMGDEFIAGQACFLEPTVLSVNDEIIRAQKIIIATGSQPVVPPAWKCYGDRILTTDTLFELEQLPPTIAVIGLGVIGVEMGQALHRLGVQVVGVDQRSLLAGIQDPIVNRAALDLLDKEFPLWMGAEASIDEHGEQLRVSVGERHIVVDKILASLGRMPHVQDLGLEALGVLLDARGLPDFDPHTMQIADLPLFIAGDVSGDKAILHEANDEARIAGYNAVHEPIVAFRRKTALAITFCDPTVAAVGLPWKDFDDSSMVAGEMRFGPLGRALIMGKNRGVLRLYADRSDGRLRGASMIAPGGEHLAHLLAFAIEQNLTVYDLLRMPFYHPTLEEGLQAALYDLRAKLQKPVTEPVELQRLER